MRYFPPVLSVSEGIKGKIQLSEATYDLVKLIPDLTCILRGELEVKGKGNMKTWLVESGTTPTD